MNRRFRSLRWLLVVVVVCSLTIVSPVFAATIIVDGNDTSGEWSGISSALSEADPDETGVDNFRDTEQVYITEDNDYLYFRIDTYNTPNFPSNPAQTYIELRFDINEDNDYGDHEDKIIRFYGYESGYYTVYYYYGDRTSVPFYYEDNGGAFGSIIEIQVDVINLGISRGDSMNVLVYFTDNENDPDDTTPDFDYITYDYPPTAITLASFEATPQDEAILVTWETAMELDNVGFNLYRSTAAAGPYTQLNAALIPPQFPGQVMGGYYEWLDTDVQPDATYYYKLEDIDVKGVSTFNGPVSTTVVSAPTAVGLQRVAARGAITPLTLGLTMLLGLVIVYRQRYSRSR